MSHFTNKNKQIQLKNAFELFTIMLKSNVDTSCGKEILLYQVNDCYEDCSCVKTKTNLAIFEFQIKRQKILIHTITLTIQYKKLRKNNQKFTWEAK